MREASFRGRVTITRLPPSGRFSAQENRSANAQTSPTTMTAGVPTSASRAFWGRVSTVPEIRRWRAVVPRSKTAAGVAGSIPPPSSPAQSSSSAATPIKKTSVPPKRTSAR